MVRKAFSLLACLSLLFGPQGSTPALSSPLGPANRSDQGWHAPVAPSFEIFNPYHGSFIQPNLPLSFWIKGYNIGLEDTFDLTSTSPWPVTYFAGNGAALVDTNGNGIPDTGVIPGGMEFKVRVKVQTPVVVNPGDTNNFQVTLTSTLYPVMSRVSYFQSSVPVPFAQLFRTMVSDYHGQFIESVGAILLQPDEERFIPLVDNALSVNGGSIAETRTKSFISLYSLDDLLYYTILDRSGQKIRSSTRLSDPTVGGLSPHDTSATVAVAPDGSIGIAWVRELRTYTGYNYNIYFAILDPSGSLRSGPFNLTGSQGWSYPCGDGFYSLPTIAATGDNRFALAWEYCRSDPGGDIYDIDTAIYSTAGNQIQPPTHITQNQAGSGVSYSMPGISALSNSRVMISYMISVSIPQNSVDLWYLILDSNGSILHQPTNLSNDQSSGQENGPNDSVQLPNGSIIAAWTTWGQQVRYAVLDNNYQLLAGPAAISHPAMTGAGTFWNLSLTTDPLGHAVLTVDGSDQFFYGLIDANGSLPSPLMVFTAPGSSNEYTRLGIPGFHNTTYTITPTLQSADVFIRAPVENLAGLGRLVTLPIQFGNQGTLPAPGVVVTASLGSGLSYVGDTSSVTPTLQANSLAWSFPTSLGFLGAGRFDLILSAPQAEIGSTLPVTLTVHTAAADGNLLNNTFVTHVILAPNPFTFLPIVGR